MNPPVQSGEPASFLAMLAQLEDGVLVEELTDQLRELVSAMHAQARDAGGKPTAKLTVVLSLKLDGGLFEVSAGVSAVPPKPVRPRSLFYRAGDNTLTPNNPKQLELGIPPKDVVAPTAGVRVVR